MPLLGVPRGWSRVRRLVPLAAGAVAVLAAAALVLVPKPAANAAAETVNVWLTTTNDGGGRNVTRGLAQQSPVSFASSSAAGAQTITVDENVTYQKFVGAGASLTDTAAWLMNSSGALTPSARTAMMQKLFD
ncbi:MAG: ricin lectin, partial [Dactylosporangium sp.]|nr:ricin lectin [Dactylosporangium sp.]